MKRLLRGHIFPPNHKGIFMIDANKSIEDSEGD
jgi:hypothetical protein